MIILAFIIVSLPVKAESFSRGTRLEIGGDGVSFQAPGLQSPVVIKRTKQGAELNFSITKQLLKRPPASAGQAPTRIIRPIPSSLTDSNEFFKNVGK